MPPRASPLAIWVGILTLYFVWGSTYLAIRVGVETIPPFLLAGLRFLVSGAMLLALEALMARRSRRRDPGSTSRPMGPSRREWRDATIVGAALLFGGMGFVAVGEKTVPSGIAAVLIAMLPVWIAVFGRVFLGERLQRAVGLGIVVGLAGVALLVAPIGSGVERLDPIGVVFLLVSPMFWAAGSLYSSHGARLPQRPLMSTGAQMLSGGILLLLGSAVFGELRGFDPAAVSFQSLAGLAYLTTVGSLVGFATFGWLIQVAPISKVTTYAYVNPIVAVILGAILLSEKVEPRTFLAGAVIVFAVALIITARGRTSPPAGATASSPAGAVAINDAAPERSGRGQTAGRAASHIVVTGPSPEP